MAITAPRKTSDTDLAGFLSPEMSAPYFTEAAKVSVVQALARRVPLSINGNKTPIVTSKMQAGWVGEGGQKPASQAGLGVKSITPHKIAAIAVVSAEVVRANPGNYMSLLRPQIAEAFAVAFDQAALYNRGPNGEVAGGVFGAGNYLSATTKAVALDGVDPATETLHTRVVAGLRLLVRDGKKLNGFAFDDIVEPEFLDAVDKNNRPIYIDTPLTDTTEAAARPGRLIARRSVMQSGVADAVPGTASTAYTVGFGGDWTQVVWGAVGGISYDVSTQATVTINGELTSLWENNLVAIRAEAEYGFLLGDAESFVEYQLTTDA